MTLVNLFLILTIYHAVMEVISTMPATEKNVIKAEFAKERIKSDWVKPFIKLSKLTKVSAFGSEKGEDEIKKLPLTEFIKIIAIGARKTTARKNRRIYIIDLPKLLFDFINAQTPFALLPSAG